MNNKGFTLIEILVAAVILAIGIAAALSVQWNTLGGYTQARDTSHATKIGQRLIEVARAEVQQWGASTDDVTSAVSNEVYQNATGVSSWNNPPILAQVVGSDWTSIFSEPVDVRLADTGNTRFCAWGRGKQDTTDNDMLKLQFAVVFPKPGNSWSSGTCGSTISTSDLDASNKQTLELTGYNAVYMATILKRRDHL